MLQWGRVVKDAEMYIDLSAMSLHLRASMGPRRERRGNALRLLCVPHGVGFASMGPRRERRGNAILHDRFRIFINGFNGAAS